MRTQLRTSLAAGVAVALVLSLPSLAFARPSTQSRSDAAHARAHARASALLGQVRAALDPAAGRSGPATRRDLTSAILELRRALPALSPSERASATSLLSTFPPPSSTCADQLLGPAVIRTAHFCVHYSNGNTAWANTVADTLEHVWTVEVDSLHFRPPVADGDGLFDVYLQNLGGGYYGACAPAQDAAHSTASCVLDDDFDPAQFGGAPAMNSLSVTAAHEFFHAIQFAYDTSEDIWFMEGSAVWAEEQVYPDINDYLQYIPFSAIPQPRVPVDYAGVDNSDLYFRYGAVLFWKYLSGQFHDPGIVRRVWEYADGPTYSLQAVTAALAERGWTFARAFAHFGVWNTRPPGGYDDSALYPGPAWWHVTRLSRAHPSTGPEWVSLDHLTNAADQLVPAARLPKRTRLRVVVNGPDRARGSAATVQVRRRDGSVRVIDVPLDASGNGSVLVAFDPRVVASVVATLTNAGTRTTCGVDPADRYSCAGRSLDDGQPYGLLARVRLPQRHH